MNKEDIAFALDELDILMTKVARVHGDSHPELLEISALYPELRKALKEEDTAAAAETLEKISALSHGFALPADACQAYTRVYKAYEMISNALK